MPTFVARGTTIHLCATDQVDTNSPDVPANPTKEQLEAIACEFRRANVLPELPIRDGEYQLRFIGKDQDMPFYMVLAGKGITFDEVVSLPELIITKNLRRASLSDADIYSQHEINRLEEGNDNLMQGSTEIATTSNSPRQQSISNPISSLFTLDSTQSPTKSISSSDEKFFTEHNRPAKPQALCVKIAFTKESFIREPYLTTGVPLDVKIDIFFNGTLSASTFVSERYRNSEPESDELTYRFTGLRVTQRSEKPWILVPREQNVDVTLGNPKPINDTSKAEALSQWKDIGNALRQEAAVDGHETFIGQYLASLSEIEMPAEVEALQRAGDPKYGIIDVVLTAGKGSKKEHVGIEHIHEPTRMRLVEPGIDDETKKKPRNSRKSNDSSKENSFTEHVAPITSATLRSRSFADANIVAQGYADTFPREASRVMRSSESAVSSPMEKLQARPHNQSSSTRLATRVTRGTLSLGQGPLSKIADSQHQSPRKSPRNNSRVPSRSQDNSAFETQKIPRKTFRGPEPAPKDQPKQKRARIPYYIELSNRMTTEEEIAQIEAQSKKGLFESPAQSDSGSSPFVRRHSARGNGFVTQASNIQQFSTVDTPESQVSSSPESSMLGKRKRVQSLSVLKETIVTENSKGPGSWRPDPAKRSTVIKLKVNSPSLPTYSEDQPTSALPSSSESHEPPSQNSGPTRSYDGLPYESEDVGFNHASDRMPSGSRKSPLIMPKDTSDASLIEPHQTSHITLPSIHHTPSFHNSYPSLHNGLPRTNLSASGPADSANRPSRPRLSSNPSQVTVSLTSSTSRATSATSTPIPVVTPLGPPRHSSGLMGPPRPLWVTPATSEGCVITFPPEGLRPVKLERNGVFKEYAILVGVRFVVG